MATKLYVVTGDRYRMIDRRIREIKRQLDQDGGSPLDPIAVADALQQIVEGRGHQSTLLLKQITTVSVGGTDRFCAKDHLKEANVGWTGSNFQKLFLEKVEEGVPEASIVASNLERDSLDAPIMAELGDCAEIQLAYLFELLKRQSKGEEGTLLVNGYANIAYIRGTDGNFWAVYAGWYAVFGDWGVNARSVEDPDGWHAGRQVLSRNF